MLGVLLLGLLFQDACVGGEKNVTVFKEFVVRRGIVMKCVIFRWCTVLLCYKPVAHRGRDMRYQS